MFNLGVLYFNGGGLARDYSKTREWWEKAATAGEARSMFDLGGLYDYGLGVAQDYAKARAVRKGRRRRRRRINAKISKRLCQG